MKQFTSIILLFIVIGLHSIYAQTIENLAKELPSHFSVLTNFGFRPEWDETSENIYFLNKMVCDVFKINFETRELYKAA